MRGKKKGGSKWEKIGWNEDKKICPFDDKKVCPVTFTKQIYPSADSSAEGGLLQKFRKML